MKSNTDLLLLESLKLLGIKPNPGVCELEDVVMWIEAVIQDHDKNLRDELLKALPEKIEQPKLSVQTVSHRKAIELQNATIDNVIQVINEVFDKPDMPTRIKIGIKTDDILPRTMACDKHETFDDCPVIEAKAKLQNLLKEARRAELNSLVTELVSRDDVLNEKSILNAILEMQNEREQELHESI